MSDGAISQDEIDALLSGVAVGGLNDSGHVTGGPAVRIDAAALQKFTDNLKDSLADKLSGMTGSTFISGAPTAEALDRDKLLAKLPETVVAATCDFSAGLSGDHMYILAPEFAQKLVNLISKEENADFDEMALSCICDVVSMHTGNEVQELDKVGLKGVACNPAEAVNNPKAMIRIPQNQFALLTYPVTLDGQEYTLWEALGGQAAEKISGAYGGDVGAQQAAAAPVQNAAAMQQAANMNMNMAMPQQQMMNMGMQQPMMNMMPNGGMQQMPQMMGGVGGIPNVQNLQYPTLQGTNIGSEQGNISLIMDVSMEVTVELGRTKKTIKDILSMGEGTIIELDKLAGEAVDILVNHKAIAKGEVVVIDENFGVRVTEILSPLERVSDLH